MATSFDDMVDTVASWFTAATAEERKAFSETAPTDLIQYHSSLGREIRNHFELWNVQWTPKLVEGIDTSVEHPDAVSQAVIVEVWNRVQSI